MSSGVMICKKNPMTPHDEGVLGLWVLAVLGLLWVATGVWVLGRRYKLRRELLELAKGSVAMIDAYIVVCVLLWPIARPSALLADRLLRRFLRQ